MSAEHFLPEIEEQLDAAEYFVGMSSTGCLLPNGDALPEGGDENEE